MVYDTYDPVISSNIYLLPYKKKITKMKCTGCSLWINIRMFNFYGWPVPQNYSTNKHFPNYSRLRNNVLTVYYNPHLPEFRTHYFSGWGMAIAKIGLVDASFVSLFKGTRRLFLSSSDF